MGRRGRADFEGASHHVINRGIAKRPLFEDSRDIRYFLSRLAHEVHDGRLQVQAFAILTTHFHLLVRSPLGQISAAMQRVQNEYVRHFNRRHRRDGPLVRGRFYSRRVASERYWATLIRYIDQNAVRAGLCSHPSEYRYSSAYSFYRNGGRPWLDRSRVDQYLNEVRPDAVSRAAAYDACFGTKLPVGCVQVLERNQTGESASEAVGVEFDNLVGQAPGRVRQWMIRKARLADASSTGEAVLSLGALLSAIDTARTRIDAFDRTRSEAPSQRGACRRTLVCGLARTMVGLAWKEIGAVAGTSVASAPRHAARHDAWVLSDDAYAALASDVATLALHACHAA